MNHLIQSSFTCVRLFETYREWLADYAFLSPTRKNLPADANGVGSALRFKCPWRRRQKILPKLGCLSVELNGIMSQNTLYLAVQYFPSLIPRFLWNSVSWTSSCELMVYICKGIRGQAFRDPGVEAPRISGPGLANFNRQEGHISRHHGLPWR